MEKPSLASFIDHTLLKKEATFEEIKKLCEEALKYHFKSICIYPEQLVFAKQVLPKSSKILKVAVVDFPLGQGAIQTKAFEAKRALELGADELDLVIDYHALQKKDYRTVFLGIEEVVKIAKEKPVKAILETSILTMHEKIIGAALAKAAKALFVKTSTGYSEGGATVEDIRLLREVVGKDIGVKASGKIRSYEQAKSLIEAGASRLGVSSSVNIILEEQKFNLRSFQQ